MPDIHYVFAVCKRERVPINGYMEETEYYRTINGEWFKIADRFQFPDALIFDAVDDANERCYQLKAKDNNNQYFSLLIRGTNAATSNHKDDLSDFEDSYDPT